MRFDGKRANNDTLTDEFPVVPLYISCASDRPENTRAIRPPESLHEPSEAAIAMAATVLHEPEPFLELVMAFHDARRPDVWHPQLIDEAERFRSGEFLPETMKDHPPEAIEQFRERYALTLRVDAERMRKGYPDDAKFEAEAVRRRDEELECLRLREIWIYDPVGEEEGTLTLYHLNPETPSLQLVFYSRYEEYFNSTAVMIADGSIVGRGDTGAKVTHPEPGAWH